jgi:hypothetical protein
MGGKPFEARGARKQYLYTSNIHWSSEIHTMESLFRGLAANQLLQTESTGTIPGQCWRRKIFACTSFHVWFQEFLHMQLGQKVCKSWLRVNKETLHKREIEMHTTSTWSEETAVLSGSTCIWFNKYSAKWVSKKSTAQLIIPVLQK